MSTPFVAGHRQRGGIHPHEATDDLFPALLSYFDNFAETHRELWRNGNVWLHR